MIRHGRPGAVPGARLHCFALVLVLPVLPAGPLQGEQGPSTQVATEPWIGSDPAPLETIGAAEAGFDLEKLEAAAALAASGDSDALLIARHGQLVLEQ